MAISIQRDDKSAIRNMARLVNAEREVNETRFQCWHDDGGIVL
ncbi:hypothetical protein [Tardiphaga sp.]|nr:hypothetical protein [Tardiphaga sp.]